MHDERARNRLVGNCLTPDSHAAGTHLRLGLEGLELSRWRLLGIAVLIFLRLVPGTGRSGGYSGRQRQNGRAAKP